MEKPWIDSKRLKRYLIHTVSINTYQQRQTDGHREQHPQDTTRWWVWACARWSQEVLPIALVEWCAEILAGHVGCWRIELDGSDLRAHTSCVAFNLCTTVYWLSNGSFFSFDLYTRQKVRSDFRSWTQTNGRTFQVPRPSGVLVSFCYLASFS